MPRPFLPRSFFERDPRTCAAEMIGCELVWRGCAGIIVETEAYSTLGDEACHTFFRKGAREFVASHPVGSAYIYLNYGIHWLLNVLLKTPREEGFVLFRAVEAIRGIEEMRQRRGLEPVTALCSGPGKLTQAFGIRGTDHGVDLCGGGDIGFRRRREAPEVVACPRIGISKATDLPWRFVLRGSPFVSATPAAGRAGAGPWHPAPMKKARPLRRPGLSKG